jgi:hypothetical protein
VVRSDDDSELSPKSVINKFNTESIKSNISHDKSKYKNELSEDNILTELNKNELSLIPKSLNQTTKSGGGFQSKSDSDFKNGSPRMQVSKTD